MGGIDPWGLSFLTDAWDWIKSWPIWNPSKSLNKSFGGAFAGETFQTAGRANRNWLIDKGDDEAGINDVMDGSLTRISAAGKGVSDTICQIENDFVWTAAGYAIGGISKVGKIRRSTNAGNLSPMKTYHFKKYKIDPHQFKYDVLGEGAKIRLWDIKYVTEGDHIRVYLERKADKFLLDTERNYPK